MTFEIPEVLKEEHRELHARLVEALAQPGEIGAAARIVADLLHPHFEKEEAFALPPLGILGRLSRGEVTPELAEVLDLTNRLETDLPEMLQEHKIISAALTKLANIARHNDRPDIAETADAILVHARAEEALAYPAAILIGRHVAFQLGRA